ncbi:DUF3164 family protein [Sphingobacterium multivorum]|uniref:DUF3164 family protein n=1 Tax=Sphingobacterium multivorum TaxID=28454 RepID=UPI003DA2AAD7
MSPAQLAVLHKQLEEKKTESAKQRDENIAAYKELVDETVKGLAPQLSEFGKLQTATVVGAFAAFDKAVALKKELYGFKDTQASHTFTTRDGNASITIGHNEIIGFDGTQSAGVSKIKEFITTLTAEDENRKILAGLLETFMKPNKKGELNPTRVAELVAQKDKVKDDLFHEGVDIIVNAQFKTRTTTFVKGWYKVPVENGQEVKVEFSISTK